MRATKEIFATAQLMTRRARSNKSFIALAAVVVLAFVWAQAIDLD